MTQAIEKRQDWNLKSQSNLAQVTGFDDRLIKLIKATVCPGATALELATFLYNARRLGLDPMTRQIYFIKYDRNKPGEIVTGIDGYRSRAENSGVYAGSDEPVYDYEDVGQPKHAPSKATVTVWKLVGGQRVAFTASARWEEFYPGDGKQGEQYRKRPHNQLAIRAESHALRKGFPQLMQELDMQAPPQHWSAAAEADEEARDDPREIARLAQRHREIFDVEEDELPTTTHEKVQPKTGAAAPVGAPESHDDERAAEIVDKAKAAARQRDVELAEIDRQRREEGLI